MRLEDGEGACMGSGVGATTFDPLRGFCAGTGFGFVANFDLGDLGVLGEEAVAAGVGAAGVEALATGVDAGGVGAVGVEALG